MLWIGMDTVAEVAGVSSQRLRFAVARPGSIWRGAALVTRRAPSPLGGGRSGLRYEVRVDSLPPALQERLKEHLKPAELLPRRDFGSREREWRWQVIGEALCHPAHSSDRAAAKRRIVENTKFDWRGERIFLSARTVDRWIRDYEQDGAGGLARRIRTDKGIKRAAISSAWDRDMRAGGADDLTIQKIAIELRGYIRGLYQKNTSPKVIAALARSRLRELTIAAEIGGASSWPDAVFTIPRRFIEAESKHRNVAIFHKDRKAFEDAKPRILRTRDGLVPMQIVVGDVHHIDICMRRPDGSIAWPKAIAWLDLATNRIWLTIVLLGPGEGIRNADVIDSFIAMCTAWGMPQTLYLDNGSEYRWPEFVNDALQLVARIEYMDDRESRIIRSKPYNAPAKAIEGVFRVLEYTYFRTLPGWSGGDRTNKKTEKVGRPTEPFPGDIEVLRAQIANHLTLYEITQQHERGALKGRSPREAYKAAVSAGWQRIAIDPRELRTVFAKDIFPVVRQGQIRALGDIWTCEELQRAEWEGRKIVARAPKFNHAPELPLLDPKTREVIGYAHRAQRYAMLDPAGAREAAKMDRLRRASIRDMKQMAPDIDPNAEIARLVGNLPPALEAPIAGTIGISPETAAIARGMAEPEAARQHRRVTDRQRHAERRIAAYDKSKRSSSS